MHGNSPREYLNSILTPTDRLQVDPGGNLLIEEYRASDLLEQYGSPLFVVSESTIRTNFRRFEQAFSSRWPGPVTIMYAVKSNNNTAIRAIIHSEGGGGDCFGLGELYATFLGGADPKKVVMNGSNKSEEELEAAVEKGVIVNIDAVEEIDLLSSIAKRHRKTVEVNLRVKIAPESLKNLGSDYLGVDSDVRRFLIREKWGFSRQEATVLTKRILTIPNLELIGYHVHTPRFTRNPELFSTCTKEFAEAVVGMAEETGFVPKMIDIGGGWPRERDPESRNYSLNPYSLEDFAALVVDSLLGPLQDAGLPIPELRAEPGRYVVGNASILLGRVGTIKRDFGNIWVNVDMSTNLLPRVDTSGSTYHIVPATGMDREYVDTVQIVGPTCIDSRLADSWPLPEMKRGEPMAVLDAGMYSESTATQFNGLPRPATILASGNAVDVIKRRETIEDVFGTMQIPDRLLQQDA